jgi:hypothetical protein
MLLRENVSAHSDNHTEHTNTLCRQNVGIMREFFAKYNENDKVKDELGRACSSHGETEMHMWFW